MTLFQSVQRIKGRKKRESNSSTRVEENRCTIVRAEKGGGSHGGQGEAQGAGKVLETQQCLARPVRRQGPRAGSSPKSRKRGRRCRATASLSLSQQRGRHCRGHRLRQSEAADADGGATGGSELASSSVSSSAAGEELRGGLLLDIRRNLRRRYRSCWLL